MRLARLIFLTAAFPAVVGILMLSLINTPQPANAEDKPAKPAPADGIDQAIEQVNKQNNGITVNRKAGYVDIDGKVCLRSAEFLEMFACTPDTREHESIVVLDAEPSVIHVGLLLLGLEPGKPLHYDRAFDPPKLVEARGPQIDVFVVYKIAGKEREIPANRWIKDNQTDKMMPGNTWLFAGSVTTEVEGKKMYLADLNGSAISLVNFGDDLLTLPNKMTQSNASHGKTWAPRTEAIPKVGTKIQLRLRPKPAEAKPAEPAKAKPDQP